MWPAPLSFSQTLAADPRAASSLLSIARVLSDVCRCVLCGCILVREPVAQVTPRGPRSPTDAAGGPFPRRRPNRSCSHVGFANQSGEEWFLCVILVSSQLSIL